MIDYLECRVIAAPEKWSFGRRVIVKSLGRLIKKSGVVWYNRDSAYNETVAAMRWLKKSGQIFHFIYGENSFRYLGLLKKIHLQNAVICTFHTPPWKFQELVADNKYLDDLDAIVVVSNSQRKFFSELIGEERVFYVPHGIDVQHYHPKMVFLTHNSTTKFKCLFVGQHMRDLNTLSESAKFLIDHDPTVEFNVVVPEKFHSCFIDLPNVTVLSKIPDTRLLELYQESDLLVLPLIDATANNSILEAMACGLPVVTTDMTATRDYLDDSCAILTPKGDVRGVVEAIQALKSDRDKLDGFAGAIRRRAMDFSWEKIATQMNHIYRKVSDGCHQS
ncbi:MAG: glycosyltransferase family 4 protein [Desulfobacteraceae bacterium]|nr:glycosyltransferase family 4 protein [Desulfobacteraceae bacterium]